MVLEVVCTDVCDSEGISPLFPVPPVRYYEALTYLVYAYQCNMTLLTEGPSKGADESLIALYRRKCLLVGISSNFSWSFSHPAFSLELVGTSIGFKHVCSLCL